MDNTPDGPGLDPPDVLGSVAVDDTDETGHDTGADDDASEPDDGSWRPSVRSLLRRPDGAIISGLSADVAASLGLDALWVRLGFVFLALIGGIGIIAYAGLWLVLVAGASWRAARVAGGVVLLGVLPLVVLNTDTAIVDGTLAVFILLVGLTLALWQSSDRPVAPDGAAGWSAAPSTAGSVGAVDADGSPATPDDARIRRSFIDGRRERSQRDRVPPSPLGRATLGLAVLTAAVGALIDELNGGRLHPEQWLGAAAVVCGLGLAVGAFRGRGRWLIVPALVFAGAGYVGGVMARADIGLESFAGDRWVYVDGEGLYSNERQETGFGTIQIQVDGAPPAPVDFTTRTGIGDVRMRVSDDVTVEFRTDIDSGRRLVNGESVSDATFTIGPDGPPDITLDTRIVRGDVEVFTYDRSEFEAEFVEPVPPIDHGEFDPMVTTVAPSMGDGATIIADGQTMMTSDGTVLLSGGEVLIDAQNQPVVGAFSPLGDRGWTISTFDGEWTLVDDLLITPFGDTLELDRIRAERGIGYVGDGDGPVEPEAIPEPTIPAPIDSQIDSQEG